MLTFTFRETQNPVSADWLSFRWVLGILRELLPPRMRAQEGWYESPYRKRTTTGAVDAHAGHPKSHRAIQGQAGFEGGS
ncbi:hypothetical protein BN874_1140007 [Candidatus Contendobacter odensis Run_B_J11]|uniref:Uncharacterized protein n=1 Tax=Candidatus Contendobacter odensis Run_B_J11 TaxID=1400861 RepID=A0A7U7G8R7_9GAMM|nr:hypothetical protein BN874_1140007 [Candidatus Contendobacter odensis Run_B_J11]